MSFRPSLHTNLWRGLKTGKRSPGSMSRISSKILENVPSANRLGLGGPSVPLGSLPARCWFCDGLLTWPSPPLPAWPPQIPNPHMLFGFRVFGNWCKILDFLTSFVFCRRYFHVTPARVGGFSGHCAVLTQFGLRMARLVAP